MNLKQWLDGERGRARALAEHIKVPQPSVSGWLSGKRPVPAQHCPKIESFTRGEVTRRELRPLDFSDYWPELATAPAVESEARCATE